MNTMLEQKRFIIAALSLLLLSSLVTMTAGTALRAGDKLAATTNKFRGRSLDAFDRDRLLKHAIKVESSNQLRSRKLEEQGAEEQEADNEGENEGEQQENNQEEQNEQDEQNENENENENDQQDQEEDKEEEGEDEENEEEDRQEEENEEEEEAQEEEEEEENQDDEEEEQEEKENDDGADDEYQQAHITFFKCVALTIEPNVVNVQEMLENGEIDEDEAAELENTYITEMTSDLNTQESVVFFSYGYGEDENRQLYMVGINDWIAASSGYDQTCNALDEDDIDQVFTKVPSLWRSPVEAYSEHAWYSGFNCKADGTGFKPHLFLDDSCTTFSRTLNQYYPFRKTNEDYSNEVSSDLTKYMIQDASNSRYPQYCDESEFCGNVLENSVSLATCEEAEEMEEQEQEEDRRRNLVSYQLEYDMTSKIEDACPSIQTAFSIDQEYEFSVDDLEALVIFWSNTVNGGQDSDRRSLIPGFNDAWVFFMGLLAILCIGASLSVSRTTCAIPQMEKSSSIDTDDTADSKKEPLVVKRAIKPIGEIPHGGSEIEQSFSAIECTLSKKKRIPKQEVSEQTEKRKTKTRQFRQFLKKSVSNASSASKAISVE